MIYDYRKNITEDIKDYLKENYTSEEIKELDYGKVSDDLWLEDSVTGNGSGSYTFSTSEAKDNLVGNEDLLVEALEEFGGDYKRALQEPEYADVTIRCYLLGECLTRAFEELANE